MLPRSQKKSRQKLALRSPLAFLFLVLFTVIVYYTSLPERTPLPEENGPICLYSNQAGGNLQKTFTDAILSAKESIVCIIYSLSDEEIIAALRQKAEEGVRVLVVHDPVATQNTAFKLGPKVELIARRKKGLMHHKLLAIDGKKSWFGSSNLTRDSLLLHANLVLGVDSPLLAKSIEEKARGKKERRILKIEVQEQTLELLYLPDCPEALVKLQEALQTAKKTIKVAMFTFTHPALVQSLVDAHKRGVEVQVVLDHDSSRQTSKKAYVRLLREGVPVRVSRRDGLLHEKVAIIDDNLLVAGSTNWTKAAFTNNDEALLLLHPLTPEQKLFLDTFWKTTLQESA